jgi:hypothetical protein
MKLGLDCWLQTRPWRPTCERVPTFHHSSRLTPKDHLFNLKFTAKQLSRQSKKANKDESAEKTKLKKAIQSGNIEGARIYAANAIRKKNEALNLLRLSSRIDGVAARVQTASTMRKVSQSMAGVVKQMDKAMQSMNLEQVRSSEANWSRGTRRK